MKKISNYYIVSQDEIIQRFSDKPDPIAYLEKELTVYPKAFGADKPEPMITYKKEDTPDGVLYYIPFRWGKDNFGEAEEDVSLGYPIKIKLNKGVSPRKEQIEPLEHCKYHLEHSNRFLLEALPAFGKCHGENTTVMMYDGSFKMVQDINVGDQLMGPDSKPRNVLNTFIGYGELFRIKPIKGEPFIVNKDHVLNLHLSGKPLNNKGWLSRLNDCSGRTINYGDKYNISLKDFLNSSSSLRKRSKLWTPDGLEFNNLKTLKIDPYILGLWLGDGNTSAVALTTIDSEIRDVWCDYFLSNYSCKVRVEDGKGRCPAYYVTNSIENIGFNNIVKKDFIFYGLMGNKHIPNEYLKSSRVDRLKLLAGLIDSDGYVKKGCCEIVQKSNKLSENICYLAKSLGFKVTIKKVNKSIKSIGFTGEYNLISILGDLSSIPVILNRKKSNPRKLNKNVLHTGFEVEQLEDGKFYGFELDADHLYLATEDLFVNHNSFSAIYLMCQLKVSVAVIVGKSALIDQWREAIKQFTNLTDDDIGLVKADSFIFENKAVTLISTDSFYDREFDDKFLNNFGAVFMDEMHNFNAQQKYQALGKFYAKYQMGMSATHDRTDGRDKVSELWFGEIAVVAGNADPVPIKVVVVPVKHAKPLNVNYQYFKQNNIDPKWSEISKLSEVPFRNKTILDLVEREYSRGGHIICVSDRIQQLQYMYDEMLALGIPEEELGMAARSYYTGHYKVSIKIDVVDIETHRESIKSFSDEAKYTLSKDKIAGRGFKTRKEANDFIQHVGGITEVLKVNSIEKEKKSLKDKEVSDILYDRNRKIVFSSYGLLKEGVSIWWKNRLFDLTPQSRAEQLLGRIGRKAEDGEEKEPAVAYTIWDYGNISQRIKRTHKNRLNNYKKMDYVTIKRAA